ncbi:uncharacterized protein LOC136026547 isoform X1 [Artemia franciscana]
MAPISKFASSPITWIFVLCIVVAAASSDKKIVCYFTNWSAYRPGIAKFTASNINPYLCTHLVYAFVGMDSEFRLRPFDKWQDIDQGAYAKFNGLKTYNKELKTLLAIGGWNEGSKRFSLLAEDSELRKNFTKSVVRYLRQYQFDGFDLDWEYPGSRDGGRPEDKENYLRLVKDLRRAFESEAKKTKRPRLLLTMAVPAGIETIEKGYDVPRLSKYLDFFNLLSYDYHASTEPLVNHHSPLRSYDETDFEHQLTVEYTVRHYLKNGAPRHKIVVGIPTYGRAYKLFNPDVNGLESPSLGPSEASKYTKEKGYMAYYEICEKIGVENWLIEKPYPEDVGPYAYSQEGDWVGYDDEDMVARKANYVLEEDLGGIMFWSLETDDFRGVCTGKQYPLLEAGKEAIIQGLKRQEGGKSSTGLKKSPKVPSNNAVRSNSVLRSLSSVSPRDQSIGKESSDFNGVTQAIFRATPPTPPTPAPDADFTCKDEGFYAHPTDCKRYFRCLDAGALGIIPNAFVCPSGLYYNKLSGSCDYSTNVICKAPVTSTFKPFLASGTSLATRSPTTTSEPFLDYVDFSSEEKDIFDDSEEVVKSKEITRSEEDSETELEKLLDLIHELGGVSRVRQLLAKSKVSSSDPEISKEQRESLKKFLDTTASASNSRRGPVGGSVPKEILEKTDFDPTFNQHDTIDAKPRQYQTIRRNRPIPPSTSEDPSTTPVIEQFISQDSDEIETDFREEDELPVSPKDEFLDSYEYYEDDILSIKATPKSVNLQRRPSVIADISSEEAEVEIEIATRTSTTTEPSTTVTTAEPTTTRRKLIRGPARRRFSSAITATTPETSVVERASVGPIRIRPPTSSKRRFVARPRSTTSQPIVEENDEVVETRDLNFRFPSPVDVEADLDDDEIIDESAEVSSVPSVTIVQSSEQVVVKSFIQKRPQPFTRLQRPSLPRRINDSPLRQRQQQPTPDPLLSESDADYYDESDDEVVDNFKENKLEKVKIVNGRVRCFDVGNFPYPGTCKKFINCARVDSGAVRAWVYTCPKELTFDPVGGLCNWGNPQRCPQ